MSEQQTESTTPTGAPAPETDAPEPSQSTEAVEPPSSPATETPAEPKAAEDPVKKQLRHMAWRAHEAERRANAATLAQQEAVNRASQLEAERREIMRRATMPTLEQHNLDPNAYQRAVDEHNRQYIAQQAEERDRRDREAAAAQQQNAIAQFVNSRIAEAQQKYADYEEVVSNPALPPLRSVNPAFFQALMESEKMPELTYYLGKNPAEANRLAAFSPAKAIIELGKIEERLSAKNTQSTAPPPPPTVGGNATVRKRLEDMSDEEFNRTRREQVKRRRGR